MRGIHGPPGGVDFKGLLGGLDGGFDVGGIGFLDGADDLLRGGVDRFEGLTRLAVHKFVVYKELKWKVAIISLLRLMTS